MAKVYPTCIIDGCEKTGKAAKGMCWQHYANNRRHGTPTPPRPPRMTLDEKVDSIGWDITEGGCWEWCGRRLPQGYGVIADPRGSRWVYLHRLMYERHVGPIPEGLLIRHKCDNPPCSNPEHLEVGTVADNSRDMVERGRHRNGWSDGAAGVRVAPPATRARCPKRGHDLTGEDALIHFPDGKAKCKACLPLDHREARARRFRRRS